MAGPALLSGYAPFLLLLLLLVFGDWHVASGFIKALTGHIAVALLGSQPSRVIVLSAFLHEAATVPFHGQG